MSSSFPAFSPDHSRTHAGSDPSPSRPPTVSAAPFSAALAPEALFRGASPSTEQDPTDITSSFFAAWGRDHKETRPERDLCYSMILQAAQDIIAANRQRRWLEAQEGAYYWCEHPYEGKLPLAVCVDVLFPDALAHLSPHQFGESIIRSARRIATLEFPNSNIMTAKDLSPVDFLQKIFGYKQKEQNPLLTE